MKVLMLNGSPKKSDSASDYFSRVLKRMLGSCEVASYSLRNKGNYSDIFSQMQTADAVVLVLPLYYDGIPSHVIPFLQAVEAWCNENPCHAKVYVLSNAGFIEGRQNRLQLEQLQCWCQKSCLSWGGGLGLGGGMMLHGLSSMLPLFIGLPLVLMLLNHGWVLHPSVLVSLAQSLGIWIFLNSGMYLCLWLMARAVRGGRTVPNRYTRVMLPGIVFLVLADLFMAISGLFNGKWLPSLYKKDVRD